jgi:fucose permease
MLPVALASGLILSGIAGAILARTWGRRVVFWGGGLCLVFSAVLLGLSHQFAGVFLAALGIGFGSSLTQVMIQALLSDQHGEKRAIALTEANVAASLSATMTPLVIGTLIGAGITWRSFSILAVIFIGVIVASFYRQAIPSPVTTVGIPSSSSTPRLPSLFWLYWTVLFLVVAVEMAIAVWGTEFFVSAAGLERATAALAFGVFPAAMFIGRATGSRLARTWSTIPLLLLALTITFIGFLVFWLSRVPALNILGLFITGFGIANQYPLTLSIAIGAAGKLTNEASARASLGVGIALLVVPLLLGQLADRVGIQSAYGIVIVLLIMATAAVTGSHLQSQLRVASRP